MKYTRELAKRGNVSLLLYVNEDAPMGEYTCYIVCEDYDPGRFLEDRWNYGNCFESLLDATESFRVRTGQTHRDRIWELATQFKDKIVDEFGYTAEDFRFVFDVDEDELGCLGFESEDEEEGDESD